MMEGGSRDCLLPSLARIGSLSNELEDSNGEASSFRIGICRLHDTFWNVQKVIRKGLVRLTPCFEVTRGLFWDGSLNFELWLEDENDNRVGTLFSSFPDQRKDVRPRRNERSIGPRTLLIMDGIGSRNHSPLTSELSLCYHATVALS
ncbi:hypothetical protein AVEN_7020-1 [Araneus ventricosus]|uniref:Uncharacterized protein n=1 Tax=Araneus ventricosus TaxID=182803 RepID=A0A4Y2IEI2_ARAVE|nr:hypothetical protein AVEN_7020-1 [Araneus ventricosus]